MKQKRFHFISVSFLSPLFKVGSVAFSTLGIFGILATPLLVPSRIQLSANTSRDPEQETLAIAKTLKPISDNQWKEIAGGHISEKYSVVEGDTLYDISGRLFGDPRYWPKIWALNNGSITNPHFITPGKAVAFIPGTGTTLPTLGVETADNSGTTVTNADGTTSTVNGNSSDSSSSANDAGSSQNYSGKSQEWRKLPKQQWESVSVRLPAEVDPLGFDRRSRIKSKIALTSFELSLIAETSKIEPSGIIIGADQPNSILTEQEIVFISSTKELKINDIYAVSDAPYELKSKASSRIGFSYALFGSVKIVGQRENLYVGIIQRARHPFYRGSILVPVPTPGRTDMDPVPAATAVDGTMMLDPFFSTTTTAQNKLVYVDRGTEDGVKVGMMFRAYQHYDSNNDLRLTRGNVLIDANLLVVQTSPKFSTVLILDSFNYVTDGTPVTLLTDVSDMNKPDPRRNRIERLNGLNDIDALDRLDNGNGLTDDEKRELQQLEQHKDGQSSGSNPLPNATGMPANSDVNAPPAPKETMVPEASEPPPPSMASEPPPPTSSSNSGGDLLPPPDTLAPVPQTVPTPKKAAPPAGGVDDVPPPPPPAVEAAPPVPTAPPAPPADDSLPPPPS